MTTDESCLCNYDPKVKEKCFDDVSSYQIAPPQRFGLRIAITRNCNMTLKFAYANHRNKLLLKACLDLKILNNQV